MNIKNSIFLIALIGAFGGHSTSQTSPIPVIRVDIIMAMVTGGAAGTVCAIKTLGPSSKYYGEKVGSMLGKMKDALLLQYASKHYGEKIGSVLGKYTGIGTVALAGFVAGSMIGDYLITDFSPRKIKQNLLKKLRRQPENL